MSAPSKKQLHQRTHNYEPLSPLSFIHRTASIYPDMVSIIHGEQQFTWTQTYDRCRRLASALVSHGIRHGDTVAAICPNTPAIYEASFGVAMMGGVLNAINTRLDADTIGFILRHGEAKALIIDSEFANLVDKAVAKQSLSLLLIVDDDLGLEGYKGDITYEEFLSKGDPKFAWSGPTDEWQAIALNYTSGTTGDPKGVVYHHRGAYLNALSNALGWEMKAHPVYLWTLPMFHCNGWCYPWTVAALGGTNICLRKVEAKSIYDSIANHSVTHFCGAPIVLSMILDASVAEKRQFEHQVNVMTAAAPPPATILENMAKAGFKVTHVYGLTETYGPATICAWQQEWDELSIAEQAAVTARQGVRYHVLQDLDVIDPDTMQPVPNDGQTLGEVMFRGNIVMKGYLRNLPASDVSFAHGWFHSGDLGVMHPDGYLEIKDRSKDIIISGGENISSIEVENTLHKHPYVQEVAVVAKPDEKWGETPCAFIKLKKRAPALLPNDIIAFCRENLAHYKVPKTVVFTELPKTSTGKIQKFKLRELAKTI